MANTAEIGRDIMMKENNLPFVSVIVPVYNGEKTIGQCIESLLAQNYPRDKYEIIVVDNNSKDKTAEIIKRYPVKYVMEDRIQSSYAARNRGIAEAKGEIVMFTDADCIPEYDWIKNLVSKFGHNIFCVAGEIVEVEPSNYIERYRYGTYNQRQHLFSKHPFAMTANVAFRREIFDRVGLFRDDLVSGGDADFCWRLAKYNYYISYAEDAKVSHQHKTSFLQQYRQFQRYAFGIACLSQTYSFLSKDIDLNVFIFLKKIFKDILRLLCKIALLPKAKDKRYHLLESLLTIAYDWANFSGLRKGFRYVMKKYRGRLPYE